jgi:hypothetical protein
MIVPYPFFLTEWTKSSFGIRRKVPISNSSVSSDSMIGITRRFFAGIRLTPGIRNGIIAAPDPRRIRLTFAVFVATRITGIIPGEFSQGYLRGFLSVLPPCLNPDRDEQRQHLFDAPPQPASALGPRLVSHDRHAERFGYALELPVKL